MRAWLGAAATALVLGAAPAQANNGSVLVFTGTSGTPSGANPAAVSALQAAGAAGDYVVDVTADATAINAANLSKYRAVVFVNSAGDVLNFDQETSLEAYVKGGGGFVGIGETAKLEEGSGFFDTLIGLTGASRTTDASGTATSDVEFNDRVHPATRDVGVVVKDRQDNYYAWANNPTGAVHTVARARFGRLPDGTSVTNDAVNSRFATTGTSAGPLQPQSSRPLSWCRDVQQGRSFYTGMGQSAAAYDDVLRKHLSGAVLWAGAFVRGNCKATINSNYTHTRLNPSNPTVPAQPMSEATKDFNPYIGEIDALAMADDGRVFYAGRTVCFAGQQQFGPWVHPTTGLGCGPIHVFDPRGAGSFDENPDRITKVADFTVFGAKGLGPEAGANTRTENGLLGIALDPEFTKGRPYIYATYHPYYGGEMGRPTGPSMGPGFVRADYMSERRLSRFTYDEQTKSLVPGSEKIIHRFMTQVYACCHLGGSMDFDSEGNLYIATGDNTANGPNSNNGGYTNAHPQYTIPCTDYNVATFEGTGCGIDTADPDGEGPLPPRTPCAAALAITDSDPNTNAERGTLAACGYTSYGDARQTAGNTNVYEGKLLRIKPLPNPGDTPGIGTTYTIPGPDAPNGPNLFAPDSQAVRDGKAKPEIFAMGVRNLYAIDVDKKTGKIAAAWVGPDQGTNSTTWGAAKTENAVMIDSAGNYGWPFCTGNNQGYRAKLPANTGGGIAAPFGHPGTVGGGVDGETGGFWDCDDPNGIVNESPFNTGLERIPPARPVNIWYGPQGGCYDFPRNANDIPVYTGANNSPPNGEPGSTSFRRCPWLLGGTQAPMTAGVYRKPAGEQPEAWPEYWEGRWFLIDHAGPNNLRHALLMNPATEFKGGQPDAVDSLYGIITTPTATQANRVIDLDFGPDGVLYVADYGGNHFNINNANNSVRRFAYVGGPDTPGPDPQAATSANTSRVSFNIGKSGGVSYAWSFSGGGTATGANVTHTYLNGAKQQATLTVTYADGETASKTIDVDVPTTVPMKVSATVPKTLGLTLGVPASFGAFTPGLAQTYRASTTASVVSTYTDAALSIWDPSSEYPGRLVNSGTAMPQALRARATNAATPSTSFGSVSANPLTLLNYGAPVSNDAVTLEFEQPIAANDALRNGEYSKTLTFTLSTTTP